MGCLKLAYSLIERMNKSSNFVEEIPNFFARRSAATYGDQSARASAGPACVVAAAGRRRRRTPFVLFGPTVYNQQRRSAVMLLGLEALVANSSSSKNDDLPPLDVRLVQPV